MLPTPMQVTDLLEAYQYCPLECDGLSKVITTLLQKYGMVHTTHVGTLTHQETSTVHVWIELETSEGHRTIDYCANLWLGQSEEVPHGVFDQADYPNVVYAGEPSKLAVLDAAQFIFLTQPVTQLLESLSLTSPVLYTVGYRQPHAEATLRFLASRGFPIIDIRERAGSRYNKAYNRARLTTRFLGKYHRVPELGNINHNEPGAAIKFKNLEAGIEKSKQIVYEDAAGQGAIYMCACENWRECHRLEATNHLLNRVPEMTVVHVPAIGPLVIQRKEE